jgi:NAD(P)-dependent dehydrogenase (short-subunit alcohol dehydrogenase family)
VGQIPAIREGRAERRDDRPSGPRGGGHRCSRLGRRRDQHSPAGGRLAALAAANPGITTEVADLSDATAVQELANRVRDRHGAVDGLVHLVGGWRGGDGFTSNSDEDWRFLSAALIDTLRHVTLSFHDDLVRSTAGRVVIVSARAAEKPSAGSANYASAKAAAEAWMLALADSFRAGAPDAAATILVIKALVDDRARAQAPARKFPGFTDVNELAARIVGLWSMDVQACNGARIPLDA